MFEPGQKVVCVDDSFPPGALDVFNALPSKGSLYTVRDVVPGVQWDWKETVAVYLVELVNKPNQHGFEPGFAPHRFAEPEEIQMEEVEAISELIPLMS